MMDLQCFLRDSGGCGLNNPFTTEVDALLKGPAGSWVFPSHMCPDVLSHPSLTCLGSIACLWWDPIQRLLFSGASDNSIIMWDIGGRKGRTLLLQGHQYVTIRGWGSESGKEGTALISCLHFHCFLQF